MTLALPPPPLVSLPSQQSQQKSNAASGTLQSSQHQAEEELPPLKTPPNQQNVGSTSSSSHPLASSRLISANRLSQLQLASPNIISDDDVFSPKPTQAMQVPNCKKAPETDSSPRSITHVRDIDFSPRAHNTPNEPFLARSVQHVKEIDFSPPPTSYSPHAHSSPEHIISKIPTPTQTLECHPSIQIRRRPTLTPPLSSKLRLPRNIIHAGSVVTDSDHSDSNSSPSSTGILLIKGTNKNKALPLNYTPTTQTTRTLARGRLLRTNLETAFRENERRISRSFSAWDMASALAGSKMILHRTGTRERLLGISVKAARRLEVDVEGKGVRGLKAAPSTYLCRWHQVPHNSAYTKPLGEMLREVLEVSFPVRAVGGEEGVVGRGGGGRSGLMVTGEETSALLGS